MQIKTKIVSRHTADSKPVKQKVNSTVILPPLAFPGLSDPKKICLFNIRTKFTVYFDKILSPNINCRLNLR